MSTHFNVIIKKCSLIYSNKIKRLSISWGKVVMRVESINRWYLSINPKRIFKPLPHYPSTSTLNLLSFNGIQHPQNTLYFVLRILFQIYLIDQVLKV